MTEQNYLELLDNLQEMEVTDFLFEKRLIFDTMKCLYCNNEMKLVHFKKSLLGVNWRCNFVDCEHYKTTLSILHGSFFQNSPIPPIKHLKIIYYLLKKIKQSNIISFVGVGQKTILKIKTKILILIQKWFDENPIRLGGFNKVVQVDETKLNYNAKSHRGRSQVSPDWALTMVDVSTTPAKGFASMVPDRSAATLLPIIEQIIRPGSSIHTDEWKGYTNLNLCQNYNHSTITHKYNFIDPITGIHTQNVESYNNKIKSDIKAQRGVRRNDRQDFLNLFVFIDTLKENAFDVILDLLKVY